MTTKSNMIVYNKEHYTIMANDIVRGKQEMTVQEARLLRLLITQVVKEDNDLKTYSANIHDLAEFMGISKQNLYRDIRDICNNLAQRVVKIGTGNPKEPWRTFQWIQMAAYDGAGTVTLMLSEAIKPFVIDLERYFTQYQLVNILEMTSFYAIRFYEILKSNEFKYDDYQEYRISELRGLLNCEKKYPNFKDFRRRVIEIAIKEINTKTDIEIREIAYRKQGRKFESIRFYVGINHSIRQQRNSGQTSLFDEIPPRTKKS